STLVYSTYLGGSDFDESRDIAIDRSGNAYITGATRSRDFLTTANAIQTAYGGGSAFAGDAFVAKIDATGKALLYSTYLGGKEGDLGHGIAADPSGNAYVTGETESRDFPKADPLPTAKSDVSTDAFVAKLSTTGKAFVYSTYLGGGGKDVGSSITIDLSGYAYVTGETHSTDFPTTANAVQIVSGGSGDAFVVKMNPAGSPLVYSTYLGGSDSDRGRGIAIDSSGNAYVTGHTKSANFPTVNPTQATFAGISDAFVTKLPAATAVGADLAVRKVGFPDTVVVGADLTYKITVTNTGPDTATGVTVTENPPKEVTFVSAQPTQGSCTQTEGLLTCALDTLPNNAVAGITIVVKPTAPGSFGNLVKVTGNEIDPDGSDNTATARTTVNAPASDSAPSP
ncbi:MAG: SBBP repeat-containing protein, partial [Candidatus Binatia bacterium]